MIPASHNTMTYLRPLGLAMLLAPFIRCQSDNLQAQFESGCRLFDFRIAFDRAGNPWFAHGLARFGSPKDVTAALIFLESVSRYGYNYNNDPIHIRIILEQGGGNASVRGLFRRFCRSILADYPSLRFFGGVAKKGWQPLFTFSTPEPQVTDAYASYHGGASHPLIGLFPRLWARRHNASNRLNTANGYLLQDFVTLY